MSFLKEFQQFAMRGNVVDMAVGIIIGGAFGTIVKSLVNDVIMPPVGILLGGIDFSDLAITLKSAVGKDPAVMLKYGAFINSVISFLIVAFCVFLLVKTMNEAKSRFETEKEEETKKEPPRNEVLLEEIRDLLKSK
ncbi:MAG: large-conductance mechanosensitive channel protein MscL [Methyloligellaceae bacterium]